MPKPFPKFRYRVDQADRIVWLDDDWLAFARENGAAELTGESLLSRPLWNFIADNTTRRLYQRIHGRVRESGATFVLPIRCDSPTLLREIQVRIKLESAGQLLYENTLMSVKVRPKVTILDRSVRRGESFLTMCSCCLKCLIEPTGWLDIEDVAQRFPGHHSLGVPRLHYTVCPNCANFACDPMNGSVG